jgi:hypothetical protein
MTLALTYTCDKNFGCLSGSQRCPAGNKCVPPTTILFDLALLITGIVVGALILSGNISLPPAAAYASFGVGGAVLVLNALAMIHNRFENVPPRVN